MNIKKLSIALLSLLLVFALYGCGKKETTPEVMPEIEVEEVLSDQSANTEPPEEQNQIVLKEIFPTVEGYLWKYDGPIETGKSTLLLTIEETEEGTLLHMLSIKDDASGIKTVEELMSKTVYSITDETILENGNVILQAPIEVGNSWSHQHILRDSGEMRYASTEITKIEDDKIYTKTVVENIFGYAEETYIETNIYVIGSGYIEQKYSLKGIDDMEMGYNVFKTYFEPYNREGQLLRDAFDSVLIGDNVAANPIIAYDNYLIGGTFAGKWMDSYDIAPKLTGQETYKVYGLEGYRNDGIGGLPQKEMDPYEWYNIDVLTPFGDKIIEKREDRKKFKDYFSDQLIFSADWDPMPRRVEQIKVFNETYIDIVRGVLDKVDMGNVEVDIKQILKTDLEGDGVDEVIITASSYKAPVDFLSSPDRYSVVILRKIIDGEVENILLAGDYRKAGETDTLNYMYYVPFVLDLNGDGRMEIITEGMYHEGHWIDILEVNNDLIQSVLADGPQL